jgi:rRNA-processing protein EBP2
MAKVKDRLIFETKKIDAVAQRKNRKEQALRAKETKDHKVAEKSQRKKQHMAAVQEWAEQAASNRSSRLYDNDDAKHLNRLNAQPNKKRMRADEKYGRGGKRPRFKQNDPKELNSPSGFNRKGSNFQGGKKSAGGAGALRKGKRARDAMRSRR